MSRVMDVPNFNLSISQALDVWTDLCDAYYGNSSFGTNVAEIYAYRLQANSPSMSLGEVNPRYKETNVYQDERRRICLIAARNLANLLCAFSDRYPDCEVYLEGEPLGTWFAGQEFDHRVHVEIRRK